MDLLDESIFILRECATSDLLMGAFSGGKDSIVLKRVCEIAQIRPEWHYHKTTIDPPEVIKFIRKHHPGVIWDRPKQGNFFNRIKQKGILPSFKRRWCCDEYKESRGPLNCVWVVGERREESPARKKQPMVGLHKRSRRVFIRPLANWDSEFLWDFIRSEKLPYPNLYDDGFKRLGCVGCPLIGRADKEKEFARWPNIAQRWREAAKYCYDLKAPWDSFKNFQEYYECWMNHKF
jgi:phosphoadenosine phosphosulfate reductase